MGQNKGFFAITCMFLLFSFFYASYGFATPKNIFKIGTGGTTGVYYPIGKLIAQGLTEPEAEKGFSGIIPSGVYPNVPETPTTQGHVLLAVHAGMHEEFIYQVTAVLWNEHTNKLLKQGHPQGKAIGLKTALIGLSIPLHEGAKRFYREQGMATGDILSQ